MANSWEEYEASRPKFAPVHVPEGWRHLAMSMKPWDELIPQNVPHVFVPCGVSGRDEGWWVPAWVVEVLATAISREVSDFLAVHIAVEGRPIRSPPSKFCSLSWLRMRGLAHALPSAGCSWWSWRCQGSARRFSRYPTWCCLVGDLDGNHLGEGGCLMEKTYLGDGVYLDQEPGSLVLTTEDGVSVTNTIYLEEEVLAAFVKRLGRLYGVAAVLAAMED